MSDVLNTALRANRVKSSGRVSDAYQTLRSMPWLGRVVRGGEGVVAGARKGGEGGASVLKQLSEGVSDVYRKSTRPHQDVLEGSGLVGQALFHGAMAAPFLAVPYLMTDKSAPRTVETVQQVGKYTPRHVIQQTY